MVGEFVASNRQRALNRRSELTVGSLPRRINTALCLVQPVSYPRSPSWPFGRVYLGVVLGFAEMVHCTMPLNLVYSNVDWTKNLTVAGRRTWAHGGDSGIDTAKNP